MARRALSDDGSFFITVPLEDLPSPVEAEIILRTAFNSFPYVYVLAPRGMVAIVGRKQSLDVKSINPLPAQLQNMLSIALQPSDMYLLTPEIVDSFSSHRINSDDRPYFFPLTSRSTPGAGEEMRRLIQEWGSRKTVP